MPMATLQLAIAMLEGGNKQVQNLLVKVLLPASSEQFFTKLSLLFQEAIEAIKEQKRKSKQRVAEKAALQQAGISTRNSGSEGDVSLATSQRYMVEVMKTMRRMCMGDCKALQDILRVQPFHQTSINFLSEALEFIKALEPEIKGCIANGDFQVVQGATRGFLMLADAMRGPNELNQKHVSESGVYDLCDRIFARIRIEHITKETSNPDWERKKNKTRADLKIAAVECLTALLEGVQSDLIPRQMLVLLNWGGVVDQMTRCYESFESGTDLDKELCVREALLYFFLLKNTKNYDKTNDYILPELNGVPQRILKFLEDRTGYIEIVRNSQLERCYFQLPEACAPGGDLFD